MGPSDFRPGFQTRSVFTAHYLSYCATPISLPLTWGKRIRTRIVRGVRGSRES